MNSAKKKNVLLAILSLVLFGIVGVQLFSTHAEAPSATSDSDFKASTDWQTFLDFIEQYEESMAPVSHDDIPVATPERNPFMQAAVTDTSGFWQNGEQKKSEASLKLQGIMWSRESKSAVIDAQILKIGDRIGGYRLDRIFPQKVILSSQGDVIQLTLSGKQLKE